MKHTYIIPNIEIILISNDEIITASGPQVKDGHIGYTLDDDMDL